MGRFDVYRNPFAGSADSPYLLDVQAELLDMLETRVVIPLRRLERLSGVRPPSDLTPIVEVGGISCLVDTAQLASVSVRALKKSVGSLADRRDDITRALDFLFQGY